MIIDTHSHVHFSEYDHDRDEVMARARAANVKLIVIGANQQTSQDAIRVQQLYPDDIIGATVGLHPTYEEDFEEEIFLELASRPMVLGIGECGLDYYRIKNQESKIKQREVFEAQIELAAKLKKPLIIHCRDAHSDLLDILRAKQALLNASAGVMHFFGGQGSFENVKDYLEMGFYISFAGVVTFKNYSYADDIRRMPLDRIVVETDAPFVAPEPYRGKRNEPSYIIETVKKIAAIRGIAAEDATKTINENVKTLFSLGVNEAI